MSVTPSLYLQELRIILHIINFKTPLERTNQVIFGMKKGVWISNVRVFVFDPSWASRGERIPGIWVLRKS